MKRTKTIWITPEDLKKKKVKASDLIESVLHDIESVQSRGMVLDMFYWGMKDDIGVCHVCLGGAAALGFYPDLDINDLQGRIGIPDHIEVMMSAFDNIRLGYCISALINFKKVTSLSKIPDSSGKWHELQDAIRKEFMAAQTLSGQLDPVELKELNQRIIKYVEILRRFNQ